MRLSLRLFIAWASLFLAPASTFGTPASGLRDCSRIDDGVKRLECFDRLAAEHAPKPAPSTSWQTGTIPNHKWTVRKEVSRIDDSNNVTLHVESTETVPGRFGDTARLTLAIICRESTTSAIFVFGGHFMSDHGGHGEVTLRIDQQPAKTEHLNASTDHQALGLWRGEDSIPFAKSLFGARKLLVRAVPYSESPLTAEFDVTGLDIAITPLREACRW